MISGVPKSLNGYQSILAMLITDIFYGIDGDVLHGMHSSVARDGIRMPFTGTVGTRCLAHPLTILALIHTATCAADKGIHAGARLARSG